MLERIGRYEVLELLAGGGQGTVYRARDTESGEVVALKVMHPGHTGEAQYLEALRREANLASRLEHPNVTRVLDYQLESGTAYMVMEYVPDVLHHHISPDSPMPPGRVLEVARVSAQPCPTPTACPWYTGTSNRRTYCSATMAP